MKRLLLGFIAFVIAGGAMARAQGNGASGKQPVPSCSATGPYTPVCGLHGPEDLEILPDHRHAVVSELPANMQHSEEPGLMLVDLVSHRVERLEIDTRPEPGWGETSCVAPPGNFGTHGLHLSKRRDGRLALLVVNHDERESIEAFEIKTSATGIRALWHGCARYTEGVFNDVASTGDGTFVAVVSMNMASRTRPDLVAYMTSGKDTGWVVEWTPERGFHRLPDSAVPMPGGVQLSPDGRFVYYTSWSGRDIRMYDRLRGAVVKTVKVGFYPDNISVRADGNFLIAGLDNVQRWRTCFVRKSPVCNESSTVVVLNPQTLTVTNLFHLGAGLLSGASVAVQENGHVYLGSPSGDRIVDVQMH